MSMVLLRGASFAAACCVAAAVGAAERLEAIGDLAGIATDQLVVMRVAESAAKPPRQRVKRVNAFGEERPTSVPLNAAVKVLAIDGVAVAAPHGPWSLAPGTHRIKFEVAFERDERTREHELPLAAGRVYEIVAVPTADGWGAALVELVAPGGGSSLAPAPAVASAPPPPKQAPPPPKPVASAGSTLDVTSTGEVVEQFSQPLADGTRVTVEVDIREWFEHKRWPSVIDVGVHEDERGGWYFLRLGRQPESAEFAPWILGFKGERTTVQGSPGLPRALGAPAKVVLERTDDDRIAVWLDGALVHQSEVGFDPDYWFVRVSAAQARMRVGIERIEAKPK